MRIVITGGAGMIGSHLVDALLDGGSEIVIVDNLLTGRRENLAHLAASPRVRIVEADISAASNLPETVGPGSIASIPSPAQPARPGSTLQAQRALLAGPRGGHDEIPRASG